MKKKILLITTGGTIGMRYEEGVGVVPSDNLIKFIDSFMLLKEFADVVVREFSNIPSPHMVPERMLELAKYLDSALSKFDGAVITHGTDTLEETAFLCDLVLTSRQPVVFTAAMRAGDDIGLDGPRNIVSAVRVAAHADSVDKGVLVVMNDEIHTARDVIKVDTGRVNSFESPGNGALGYVDDDVVYVRHTHHRETVWTDKINTNVDLIKATAGMDDRYIKSSIANKAAGIVIEAFGKGNLPPDLLPAIKKAINKNIVVVIVSRGHTGRVLPEYGYTGGCKSLVECGAVLGGDLRGHNARIKLMFLLGKYEDNVEAVQKFI
jgi:L-asparaginase